MSFSWTYLTRRFLLQNYRDMLAVTIIGSYVVGHHLRSVAQSQDNNWLKQHVYIHDESDIAYREQTNRTDGAVKREHAIKYAAKIKNMRAEREREQALDAFNYLNGKNLQIWFKNPLFI